MELTPSDSGAKRTQNTVFQVTKCIETLESTNIGLKGGSERVHRTNERSQPGKTLDLGGL